MTMPIFGAEASLYKSMIYYRATSGGAGGADPGVALPQLGTIAPLRTPIICNGNCPPPLCHFHCTPCKPDPAASTGCSRTCTSFGPGCDDPGTTTVECPSNSPGCCPVTCNSSQCTGGSCGTYPTCVRTSGTMPCHDCHGNPAPPQPC